MQLKRINHLNLTPARKQVFVRRLLKLRDILIEAPPEQYDHSIVTESGRSCGTAACAVGHAVLHHREFPGLCVKVGYNGDLDLGYKELPHWMVEIERELDTILDDQTDYYFGPLAWDMIFDTDAYPMPCHKVTKFDAIQRIEDYITQVLGCELIPE